MIINALVVYINLIFLNNGHCHGGVDHSKVKTETLKSDVPFEVKAEYDSKILPIFKAKCFDCHSDKTSYPTYYKIPGIKALMDHHIKEGREHLDMTAGYPFKSHATPLEDLKEIEETVNEGSMPPWYYRPLHSGSALTDEEKKAIKSWIAKARKEIANI